MKHSYFMISSSTKIAKTKTCKMFRLFNGFAYLFWTVI